jgi:hypothetical protein
MMITRNSRKEWKQFEGFILFALTISTCFTLASRPTHAQLGTPHLLAQIGGSACNTVSPGSPNWTGTPHGVCLTWNASTSSVAGYRLYRGTLTGGPYTLLNATLTANLFFLDATASTSTTYFYVATAVDASSDESGYSNQVSVTTPSTFQTNPSAPSGLGGKSQ